MKTKTSTEIPDRTRESAALSQGHIPGPGRASVGVFLLVLILDLAFLGLVRLPAYGTAVVFDSGRGTTALMVSPGTADVGAGVPVSYLHPGGHASSLVVHETVTLRQPHEAARWGVPDDVELPAQILQLRLQEEDAGSALPEPGAPLSVRTSNATLLQYLADVVRAG